jgi:hypothetical protein
MCVPNISPLSHIFLYSNLYINLHEDNEAHSSKLVRSYDEIVLITKQSISGDLLGSIFLHSLRHSATRCCNSPHCYPPRFVTEISGSLHNFFFHYVDGLTDSVIYLSTWNKALRLELRGGSPGVLMMVSFRRQHCGSSLQHYPPYSRVYVAGVINQYPEEDPLGVVSRASSSTQDVHLKLSH